MGLPNERRTLEAKPSEGQIGNLEKARKAQACALEVIESLSEKITNETGRNAFAAIAHWSLKPAQPDPLEIRFRLRTGA